MEHLDYIGPKGGGKAAEFFPVKVCQPLPLLQAVADKVPYHPVGLPEGQPLLGQVVGGIGGVGKAPGGSLRHIFLLHLHGGQEGGKDGQTVLNGIYRIEEGFLVLLQVLVVGQGQTLHGGEKGDQVSVNPSCLTPDEFRHIGVLFLGHDAAAGGKGIVQLDKGKFLGGPENQLLTETAQVLHEDGRRRQEFEDKIPVADGIDAVSVAGGKAQLGRRISPVDGKGGSRQGPGPQGGAVGPASAIPEPLPVPLQHLEIGQEMVGKEDGLGPLQVGIAGHDHPQVPFRQPQDGFLEPGN